MLSKLRLHFSDRPDIDLAVELEDGHADAWAVLHAQAAADGRITVGDRESLSIAEVVDVELLQPKEIDGPGFARGLQDEDVSAALRENYDPDE
jgi:hypothetical protein